jgi:hypothetical protein
MGKSFLASPFLYPRQLFINNNYRFTGGQMRALVLALVVGMIGCAPHPQEIPLGSKATSPNILVINEGKFPVVVYAKGTVRLGTVQANQKRCFQLMTATRIRQRLFFRVVRTATGEGITYQSPEFTPGKAVTWIWNVNSQSPSISSIDLHSSREPCH